jgi:molybdopterin synthase catalytic subunit
MTAFYVQENPIDTLALQQHLTDKRCGACVVFEGWVRNENLGRMVTSLTYEAWEDLCKTEAETIFQEAQSLFQVSSIAAAHRTGTLTVGEKAVWVGVAAVHRKEAFAACAYVIDEIKSRLPIWKKEHYADGSAEWVACHRCSSGASAPDDPEHASWSVATGP